MPKMVRTWANYTDFLTSKAEDPDKIIEEEIEHQVKNMENAIEHLEGIKLYLEEQKRHNSPLYEKVVKSYNSHK